MAKKMTPITDKAILDGNRKSTLLENYYLIIERMKEIEVKYDALKRKKERIDHDKR